MRDFLKKIIDSKSFKRTMITMLYNNPRLPSGEYLRLSKILMSLDDDTTQQMEIKKVA